MADLQQALPTQYSDLGSLWDRAPALAAMQTGDQMRWAQQNNQSLQDAFSNQEQFKQQSRPLELEQTRAQTGLTQAHTNYFGAEAAKLKQATEEATQTQPGRVGATNSKNQTEMGADKITQMEQQGHMLRVAAGLSAQGRSPFEQVASVMKVTGNQTPEFRDFLMQHAQGGQLPAFLKQYGDQIFEQSQAYKLEKLKQERETERAKISAGPGYASAAATVERTRMEIEAGKFARYGKEYLREKALNGKLEEQYGAAQEMANRADDPAERSYWMQRADAAQKLLIAKQSAGVAEKNTVTVNPNGMLHTQSPPGPQVPAVPVPAGAASAAPAPQQYAPGQTYKGKTGTFKYNGGDPKNPGSWTKVQ